MDRGVRIILAACILVGGGSVAMLFRHPPSRAGPVPPEAYKPLLLRAALDSSTAETDPPGSTNEPSSPQPRALAEPGSDALGRTVSGGPATVLTPSAATEPPPADSSWPSPPRMTSRWGTSMAFGLSGRPGTEKAAAGGSSARALRTHKIVDGDTLEALAERYLGSPDRFMEIFEANRYGLPSPDVLPIGLELRIPPREAPPPSAAIEQHKDLVPVRPALQGPVTPGAAGEAPVDVPKDGSA